jgi:hypothetical protein
MALNVVYPGRSRQAAFLNLRFVPLPDLESLHTNRCSTCNVLIAAGSARCYVKIMQKWQRHTSLEVPS